MEIFTTSFAGTKVTAIFNGGVYVFYNKFYGFLAFAVHSKLAHEPHHEFFTLTYGNSRCGGSLPESKIESCAKRFILNQEREHGAKSVDFETHAARLENAWLDLESAFKIFS